MFVVIDEQTNYEIVTTEKEKDVNAVCDLLHKVGKLGERFAYYKHGYEKVPAGLKGRKT